MRKITFPRKPRKKAVPKDFLADLYYIVTQKNTLEGYQTAYRSSGKINGKIQKVWLRKFDYTIGDGTKLFLQYNEIGRGSNGKVSFGFELIQDDTKKTYTLGKLFAIKNREESYQKETGITKEKFRNEISEIFENLKQEQKKEVSFSGNDTYLKFSCEITDNDARLDSAIAIPYLTGKNLGHLLIEANTNGKNFALEHRLNAIIALAKQLKQFHLDGNLHLDVKPHNFPYTRKKKTGKYTDFGSSLSLTDNKTINFLVGTSAYTDPKILLTYIKKSQGKSNKGCEFNWRNDLYSFSITAAQILGSCQDELNKRLKLIHDADRRWQAARKKEPADQAEIDKAHKSFINALNKLCEEADTWKLDLSHTLLAESMQKKIVLLLKKCIEPNQRIRAGKTKIKGTWEEIIQTFELVREKLLHDKSAVLTKLEQLKKNALECSTSEQIVDACKKLLQELCLQSKTYAIDYRSYLDICQNKLIDLLNEVAMITTQEETEQIQAIVKYQEALKKFQQVNMLYEEIKKFCSNNIINAEKVANSLNDKWNLSNTSVSNTSVNKMDFSKALQLITNIEKRYPLLVSLSDIRNTRLAIYNRKLLSANNIEEQITVHGKTAESCIESLRKFTPQSGNADLYQGHIKFCKNKLTDCLLIANQAKTIIDGEFSLAQSVKEVGEITQSPKYLGLQNLLKKSNLLYKEIKKYNSTENWEDEKNKILKDFFNSDESSIVDLNSMSNIAATFPNISKDKEQEIINGIIDLFKTEITAICESLLNQNHWYTTRIINKEQSIQAALTSTLSDQKNGSLNLDLEALKNLDRSKLKKAIYQALLLHNSKTGGKQSIYEALNIHRIQGKFSFFASKVDDPYASKAMSPTKSCERVLKNLGLDIQPIQQAHTNILSNRPSRWRRDASSPTASVTPESHFA